jgi:aldose sugar dehydrogenase
MSRYRLLFALAALTLVIATCGNGDDEGDTTPAPADPTPTPTESAAGDPTPVDDPTPEPAATPTETPQAGPSPAPEPEPELEPTPTEEPEPPADPEVTTFIEGVSMPSSLTFTNDGRMFFNEVYDGRIRVVENSQLLDEPFALLDIAQPGGYTEHGLLGLALHPGFDTNGYVYVFYTVGGAGGQPIAQRIVRFTDQDNVATDETVIVDNLPYGPRCCHNGGRIAFGPDGMLYATIGDVEEPGNGQNPGTLGGSVLRYTPDGAIPDDNPFGPDNPVFAYGLRNPYGLTFHPETGDLFITENGPQGYDEVNRIVAGGNYGWPEVQGMAGDDRFIDPIWATTTERVAPTGISIPTGAGIPALEGKVLFCMWNLSMMLALEPADDNPDEVVDQEQLPVNRNLDVTEGPDGAIYASTNVRIYRYGPPVD